MKLVSNAAIIENPAFVANVVRPELGGQVALYEDGSMYNPSTGKYYAPEAEDVAETQMRADFDRRKAIHAGDRYMAVGRTARQSVARYGLVMTA